MKTCRVCSLHAANNKFVKNENICKPCNVEEVRRWYKENPDKVAATHRKAALKKNYGITPEQWDEMFENQKGCCAICDRHQDMFKKRLAVDHNHETGEIRGLLCAYCNHRVVGRHRDGAKLRKIADYVDQGTGWYVPKKRRPVKRKHK